MIMFSNFYAKVAESLVPSQMEPITGREAEMSKNYAGGYTFKVTPLNRALRFMILGSEKNYYKSGPDVTKENIQSVQKLVNETSDGLALLDLVINVYENGRAAKQQPILLLLAILCRADDKNLRKKAWEYVPKLRTLSQLYTFKMMHQACGSSKGWGRLSKNAFQKWFANRKGQDLAYQCFKYQQRDGWSARDFLRCCHLNPNTLPNDTQVVLRAVVKGLDTVNGNGPIDEYLKGVSDLKKMESGDLNKMIDLVYKHRFTREFLPTWALNHNEVWLSLLRNKDKTRVTMPYTALIRNLGVLTKNNIFNDYGLLSLVTKQLENKYVIGKARIHPVSVLLAHVTYKQGHGTRGSLSWTPIRDIQDSLESAFYSSFANAEPTNKRILHAIDASGSMTCQMAGLPMTSAEAVACLAMVFSRAEKPETQDFALFTDGGCRSSWGSSGWRSSALRHIMITPKTKLEDAARIVQVSDWGGTDCSLPVIEAEKEFKRSGKVYDAFIIYTDNDTWAGNEHVSVCLERYRKLVNLPVRMVVVATTASGSTIADPKDPLMLDVVGFDAQGAKLVSNFIRGDF